MSKIYDRFILYQHLGVTQNDRCMITLDNDIMPLKNVKDHYFLDFFNWSMRNTFLEAASPILFWRNYGYIHQLDNLFYDDDTIEYLNEHGLSIYLYESCMFYTKFREVSKPNKEDTNSSYLNREYGHVLYDAISIDDINHAKCYEFDSIKDFVIRNRLTKVKVLTGYYGIKKLFQNKYPEFSIMCNNSCLSGLLSKINRSYDHYTITDKITKKFFSPAWRYSSARHLIQSFMIHKDAKMSWYYNGGVEFLQKNLWFDTNNSNINHFKIRQGAEKLNFLTPLRLDSIVGDKVTDLTGDQDFFKFPPGIDGCSIENSLEKWYDRCFCTIAIETFVSQPMSVISEKILIPMKCRRPFVAVGGPSTLKYLKKLGFKTFDQWWDESYDQEQDHEKRILKIFQVIDYIDSFDIQQLKEMYLEMQDVLEHNYHHLQKINKINIDLT